MQEFSWYTDEKPHISTYINGAPKKRYLVVDGIAVIGRAVVHYKPNRKGGYNRKKNRLENLQMLSVYGYSLRRIVKRDLKFSLNKKKINKMRFLKLGTVIELSEDEVIKIEDAEDGRK